MRVQVDKAGSHHQPGGFQSPRLRSHNILSNGGHTPLAHQNVGLGIDCLGGIDYTAILDQQITVEIRHCLVNRQK